MPSVASLRARAGIVVFKFYVDRVGVDSGEVIFCITVERDAGEVACWSLDGRRSTRSLIVFDRLNTTSKTCIGSEKIARLVPASSLAIAFYASELSREGNGSLFADVKYCLARCQFLQRENGIWSEFL